MNAKEAYAYLLAKKGAVADYPFGPEHCVPKVGGKMFAILTGEAVSLKCEPALAELLRRTYPAIQPGYHLNKTHWNTIALDGSVPDAELRAQMDMSYDLVLKSLTRAARAAVLEGEPQ
jgi:predicted DNA-binding protein (MmcQ/YjbR family)